MRLKSVTVLLSLTMAACNSPTASNPAVVAPTPTDWATAFSRLPQDKQTAIQSNPLFVQAAGSLDESIYSMSALGHTEKLIGTERLDVHAMCDGFNAAFGRQTGTRWTIVEARSYEQIGAPSGIQEHRVELDWTFREASTGKTVPLVKMDAGPGVNIKWVPSQAAVDAEMNQAFAITFLDMMADLIKHRSGSPDVIGR